MPISKLHGYGDNDAQNMWWSCGPTRSVCSRYTARSRSSADSQALGSRVLREVSGRVRYVLRGSDQRARASMRVQAIGVFVPYVTATGY